MKTPNSKKGNEADYLYNRLNAIVVIAIVFILLILSFFTYFLTDRNSYWSLWIGFLSSTASSVFVLCAVYLLSFLYHKRYEEYTRDKLVDDIRKAVLGDKFDFIRDIYYKISDVKWDRILDGNKSAKISMAYVGRNFLSDHGDSIKDSKCDIDIFIASPDQSDSLSRMLDKKPDILKKIIIDSYINLKRYFKDYPSVRVYYSSSGANFMAALTEGGSHNSLIFSPYAATNNKPPTLEFDSAKVPTEMMKFITSELNITENTRLDMEYGDHVKWSQDKKSVFISSALSCAVGCPYCYIGSIKKPKEDRITVTPELVFSAVASHVDFLQNETTIFLGGFNDPFSDKLDADFNVSLIRLFNLFDYKNPIHIATKFPAYGYLSSLTAAELKNVVVNSSFSSLEPQKYGERTDVESRFADLESLVNNGVNVTLYVRPILPGVTVKHATQMADLCIKHGIKYVTLGGLYSDARIERNLAKHNVVVGTLVDHTRTHVLDSGKSMQKIANSDDFYTVHSIFSDAKITVFQDSASRVKYFRLRRA